MKNKLIIILILVTLSIAGSLAYKSFSAKSSTAIDRTGLVGYWTMDTNDMSATGATLYDKSGKNNNGIVFGTTTSTGRIRQARTFNGTSNYVNLGAPSTFNFGAGNFAFSVWIKLSTSVPPIVSHGYQILSKDGSVGPGRQWIFSLGNDQNILFAYFISDGVAVSITSNRSITDMNWHHVIGQRNGNSFDVYIDGTSAGSGTTSGSHGTMQSTATNLTIGRREYASYLDYFPGQIDDVRVYNRALSAQEVSQLYSAAKTNYTITPSRASSTVSAGNRLVGHWTMDANDINGTTYFDKSGNGKNVVSNGSLSFLSGKIKQGVLFDASGEWLKYTGNLGISGNSALTLSAWVKPAALSGTGASVFGMLGGTSDTGVSAAIFTTNGNVSFSTGGCSEITADNTLTAGRWYHIVATKTPGLMSTTAIIYVDGVSKSLTNQYGDCTPNFTTTKVMMGDGWWNADTTYPFAGAIDDVRVYNYALSAQEVANLYNSSARNYSVTPPREGLVGYWTMDTNDINGTTMYDKSGYNNSAVLVGGPLPTSATGKIKQALNFSVGGTGAAVASSTVNLPIGASSRSMFGWIKGTNTERAGFFGYGNATVSQVFDLSTSVDSTSGKLYFIGYNNDLDGNTVIIDGKWHFVGVTYNGTTVKTYVDGVLDNQADKVLNTGTTYPMRIGSQTYPDGLDYQPFSGSIDDVRIYNRALSAQEVANLYASSARTLLK